MIRYWGSKDEAHSVDTNDYFRRFGTMWTTHAIDHGPESDRILFQDGGNVGKVDAGSRKIWDFQDKLTDAFVKVKFALHDHSDR
jgi:hypothetical protein